MTLRYPVTSALVLPEPGVSVPQDWRDPRVGQRVVATARIWCRGPFRPCDGKSPRHRRHAVATTSPIKAAQINPDALAAPLASVHRVFCFTEPEPELERRMS